MVNIRYFLKIFLCVSMLMIFFLNYGSVEAQKLESGKELSNGLAQFEAGDYSKALEHFQAAAQADPNSAEAQYYLGLTYLRMKQDQESLAFFQKALALDSKLSKVHFDLGLAYYHLGKLPEALEEFKKAEKAEPNRAIIYYYQGLVYHKLEDYRKTPPLWQKSMELDPTLSVAAHYYNGVGYYRREFYDEAEKEFQETIKLEPASEIAQSSKRFLETIPEKKAEKLSEKEALKAIPAKKFRFDVGVGYFYDDNVILKPMELDIPPLKEEDFSPTFFLSANYKPINNEKWEVSGTYRFDGLFYQRLDDFSSMSHVGVFDATYKADESKQIIFDYYYTYYALGGHKVLIQNTFSPGFRWAETAYTVTELRYDLSLKDFTLPIVDPEDNRNATNKRVSLAQYLFFSEGKRYLRLLYSYADENAKGANRDYKANSYRVSYSMPFYFISEVVFTFDYEDRDFKHTDTFFDLRRADISRVFSVDFKKRFWKTFLATLSYEHTRNGSNVDVFNYERDLVGVVLQYTF